MTSQIENELGLDENDGERKSALRNSLKKMFDFFEKGGEVDFVVPEDDAEATDEDFQEAFDQLKNISAGVERIRVAERTKTLIEDQSNEE